VKNVFLVVMLLGLLCVLTTPTIADEPTLQAIRVGMIGLDTSHVVAFAQVMRGDNWPADLPRLELVAAFPGGSPDFPPSRDRVKGFTEQLAGMGVEMVDSIDALLPKVDAVLLESVDGNQHLEYAKPVLAAGKPVFIDKPLAASLADAVAISMLAKKHGTPWFTASFSRCEPAFRAPRFDGSVGKVLGCDAYGPTHTAPNHPDLFFYGVHGVDLLYTVMGPGCQSVSAVRTDLTESIRGVWNDGRIGNFRSIRGSTGKPGYGFTAFGTTGIAHENRDGGYAHLVPAIARFLHNKQAPADAEEMVEVIAYMAAAEASIAQGGTPVDVNALLEQARVDAAKRLETLP
jgi:predicted dehydrogenase